MSDEIKSAVTQGAKLAVNFASMSSAEQQEYLRQMKAERLAREADRRARGVATPNERLLNAIFGEKKEDTP
jgi:hypothetical protein